MFKAIIFDVFGTLISTGNGSLKATQNILNQVGSDADTKEFYSQWKELYRELSICKNGFITEKEIFQIGLNMLYERYHIESDYLSDAKIMLDSRYNRKAFDDVAPCLETLNKYKLIIGSNTDNDPLIKNLEDNNINVDNIFSSEDLRYYKPNKIFYKLILEKMSLLPSEVLFVGDSLIDDVYGPQQLGIKTVLINRKEKYVNEKGIRPDYVVNSLADVWDIVNSDKVL